MFDKVLITAFILMVMGTFSMCANVAKAQLVTDGLVSYWSFDEDTIVGDTVKDVWGENNGTIMGDPQTVRGKIGDALEFDGVDDYVQVAADPSLDFAGELTLEAWVKTSFSGTRQAVINNRGGTPWYVINIDPAYLMLSIHDGSEAVDVKPADVNVSDGEWHHFVGTMDNTEANGAKIYLDGDLIDDVSVNAQPTAIDPFVLPYNTAIGGDPNGGKLFHGTIDEIRIYSRALSEDEILQNMNAEGLAVMNLTGELALTWGGIKISN